VDVVIRLPLAPPQDYLLWLDWWEAVEEVDTAQLDADVSAEVEPGRSASRLIPVHVRIVAAQARAALEHGRSLVAPDLAGDSTMWERSIEYGHRRRDRLRRLSREGVGVPAFPDKLVALREAVIHAIQSGLDGSGTPLSKGLHLFPRPLLGHLRLIGELDHLTVEQLEEACRAELDAGSRLHLDVAGITFMDSQGLRLLIRLGGMALESGLGPVVVANPSGPMQRVLKLAVPKGIPGLKFVDTVGEFDGPPR
jgi:anti-anti-sigma factor